MGDKLRNYQVLDVLSGGTFYKVRHKLTRNIFAWKAYNCSLYSRDQIQNITNDVRTISGCAAEHLLRYYDTILHTPSKTLYLVVEFMSWRSLDDVIRACKEMGKYVSEGFVWYLLYEVTRMCKDMEQMRLVAMRRCIATSGIYVDEGGDIRVNCFDVALDDDGHGGVMRQLGDVIHTLMEHSQHKYSEDLIDVVSFVRDDKNSNLRPDVLLYHPTVLANLEVTAGSKKLTEVLLPMDTLDVNLCDSEKAVGLCGSCSPESPTYVNINNAICVNDDRKCSLSPTIAALALELPGFVPRTRHAIAQLQPNSPQRITQKALSHQWMSRLIALREREASLNKRERDILTKEVVNSPAAIIYDNADGITLPTIITTLKEEPHNTHRPQHPRRRRRRTSMRTKRTTSCYEDLDSSLSADNGDGSMIITATKLTTANMPTCTIFPPTNHKKVHFTANNPFTESDDSVTLTFYELDDKVTPSEVNKFKYMSGVEKRCATSQCNSSPSKQAKTGKNALTDITNQSIGKTPSKSSVNSKRCDRYSMAPPHTEVKKAKGRKSLLSFKTPFKFMSSSKV